MTDLRNAFRALRAAPGFTAVALVILTLGVGATTTIFSVVDAVVLRNLPYDDPDRLISVSGLDKKAGRPYSVAPQDFIVWKAQQTVFEGIAARASAAGFTIKDDGRPEDLRVLRVSANLFSLLHAAPRIGHVFSDGNEVDGNHRVAIISDTLWRRRFNADPNIVGRTMTFDDGVWQVVGVMPPTFNYPVTAQKPYEMWVPYVLAERDTVRGPSRNFYLQVVGRLKPGVSIEQARAQMEQITASLAQQYPDWYKDRGILVRTVHEALLADSVRSWMLMLLGAVGFVLLIACVNVANLMLARATSRAREFGIRAALGATRAQLVRALVIESLVLSVAGTIGGVIVAWWGVDILRAALPSTLPRVSTIAIDLRVLMAAGLASILTGLAFGLAPALQFSRPDLVGSLREGGRANTAGVRRQRLRSVLLVAEVALAVILLVGSGLFISSFARLMRVDIGLDYHNVLTVPVYPKIDYTNRQTYPGAQKRAAALVGRIVDRVRALPGVEVSAALTNGLPLSGSWSRTDFKVKGTGRSFDGDDSCDVRQVTADYNKAIHLPVLRGRWLADTDRPDTAKVVVINDEAARRYFDGHDPIGMTVDVNGERTVVGVVPGIRLGGPETPVRPEAYMSMVQDPLGGADLVVRTRGRADAILPAVKEAIWAEAPSLSIPDAMTLEEYFSQLIAQRKFNMLLLGLFGLLAIAIASVGIYGVMAYIVAQRTQEIGVRMALGALPAAVLRMVLLHAATYVIAGLMLGLGGAWALARLVTTFLFHVEAHDPIVYLGVAAVLLAGGLVAAFVPARRASKVDPLVALRAE